MILKYKCIVKTGIFITINMYCWICSCSIYVMTYRYTQICLCVGLKTFLFRYISAHFYNEGYGDWISFDHSIWSKDSYTVREIRVAKPSSGGGNSLCLHLTSDIILVMSSLAMEGQPYVVLLKASSHTGLSEKMPYSNCSVFLICSIYVCLWKAKNWNDVAILPSCPLLTL